jgi:hypothetical protein
MWWASRAIRSACTWSVQRPASGVISPVANRATRSAWSPPSLNSRWQRRWIGHAIGLVSLMVPPSCRGDPHPHERPNRNHPPPTAGVAPGSVPNRFAAPLPRSIWRRGLRFDDPEGRVLRFAASRARKNPAGELENHPAMLSLLSDLRTGEPCGIINCCLQPDGSDRIRDAKGKTVTGRAKGAVVLLSPFCEPTDGLTICEGTETGVALLMAGLAPVWACGGAGNLAAFPVLGGIEALTIGADTGKVGQNAAAAVAARWQEAARAAVIIAPPAGDWAAPRCAA